jgi:hypothetical protein
MACGGCAKRRAASAAKRQSAADSDLMGGYANLTNQQIKARLEAYKRRYCKECETRYECDYARYLACKKNK